MSLDISLTTPNPIKKSSSGIFIREDGQNKEISKAEWNAKFSGTPLQFDNTDDEIFTNEVFNANITHNLNTMADRADLYKALWKPEEIDITKGHQLIPILQAGLTRLKNNPEFYKQFNPPNGWGSYENLVDLVERYLQACIEYPDAEIKISR